MFVDGSCLLPQHRPLRNAAWAVALAASSFQSTPQVLQAGPLPGILQTRFRAEIYAFLAAVMCVEASVGCFCIWSDCAGVVSRVLRFLQGCPKPRFIFAKVFQATAIVLDLLQKECFPRSYGIQTFPQTVQSLIHFLEQYPDDQQLRTYNQDLVGFFTTIPVERILRSVEWLVETFTSNNGCNPDSVLKRDGHQTTCMERYRPRQGSVRMCSIKLRDIVSICELSCQRSFFTVSQKIYEQQRGAAIGNQISPMLASLTVSLTEQQWHHRHQELLQQYDSQFLCLRYVDNRIVLLNPLLHCFEPLREFLDDNFYVAPVQLEAVPSVQAQCKFLGFDIRLSPTRSFQLIMQNDLWRFKLPSRFHAITKYVWPQRVSTFASSTKFSEDGISGVVDRLCCEPAISVQVFVCNSISIFAK